MKLIKLNILTLLLLIITGHFSLALVGENLNELNTAILTQLQEGGEAFVSNAIINGKYVLRACFVNFRSTIKDVEELVEIVVKLGRNLS